MLDYSFFKNSLLGGYSETGISDVSVLRKLYFFTVSIFSTSSVFI
jgi:hypothetical protein